jgi:hypothetical protein
MEGTNMSQSERDYSEKRDFIRMTVDAKVTLRVDGQSIAAICRDLSSNGMQVEAQSALRVGEQLQVHLPSEHPSLRDLNADAEVVRSEPAGPGRQTLGLSILKMN